MAFLLRNSSKLSLGNKFLKVYFKQEHQQGLKITSINWNKQSPDASDKDSSTAQKKQKFMITLLQNENMTVTALEDAKNLAKRRSMHLVKVQEMDTKTQRPIYRLLTPAEMLQNELAELKNVKKSSTTGATKKSEKSLNITSRIAEHDLSSRLKNISKWLNKQHEVRILIQGSSEEDLSNCEKIFKTIEEYVKTPQVIGKIVQKRSKGSIVKFSILPVTPAANGNETEQ